MAPAELQEAVRGRKETAQKDFGEIGLAEKSNPAAGTEIVIMTYFEFCG